MADRILHRHDGHDAHRQRGHAVSGAIRGRLHRRHHASVSGREVDFAAGALRSLQGGDRFIMRRDCRINSRWKESGSARYNEEHIVQTGDGAESNRADGTAGGNGSRGGVPGKSRGELHHGDEFGRGWGVDARRAVLRSPNHRPEGERVQPERPRFIRAFDVLIRATGEFSMGISETSRPHDFYCR